MAIAIVQQWSEASPNSAGFTTTSKDTTGADYLVVMRGNYNDRDAGTNISDNKSNTFTKKTGYGTGGGSKQGTVEVWICESPTVGAGHTFSTNAPGNSCYDICFALALSGTAGVGAWDSETGTDSNTATTQQAGSITPAASGEIFVAFESDATSQGSSQSIDSGFTMFTNKFEFVAGTYIAGSAAYKIKTDAAAENPTMSGLNGGGFGPNSAMMLFCIKSSGGGGGGAGNEVFQPLSQPTNHYRPDIITV